MGYVPPGVGGKERKSQNHGNIQTREKRKLKKREKNKKRKPRRTPLAPHGSVGQGCSGEAVRGCAGGTAAGNLPWLAVALRDGCPGLGRCRAWLLPPRGLPEGSPRVPRLLCCLSTPPVALTIGADLPCTGPFHQWGTGFAQGQERQVWGSPQCPPPQSWGHSPRSAPRPGSAPARAQCGVRRLSISRGSQYGTEGGRTESKPSRSSKEMLPPDPTSASTPLSPH